MKNSAQQKSDLDYRINRAQLAGAMHGYTLAEFKNYILNLGLTKYEKSILPVEKEGEYKANETDQSAKILPFPGVSLIQPEDKCQSGLDDFLHEMGYIK